MSKKPTFISQKTVAKRQRLCIFRFLAIMIFLSTAFFIGTGYMIGVYREGVSWVVGDTFEDEVWAWLKLCQEKSKMKHLTKLLGEGSVTAELQNRRSECETRCLPDGSEALPKGIVAHTSDLEMRSLWGSQEKEKSKGSMSLLAIAAGIQQKESVNKIIEKFPASDFVLMLFHYDGLVDGWKNFEWNARAIHVSAVNQTKWWFAKRFLHPDIVSEYSYIFLWDEDLGVDNFDAKRYLSIVRKEGLEISQPALDPDDSEVHHPITARVKDLPVHRKFGGKFINRKTNSSFSGYCMYNKKDPPCAGFVEIMAPAFSRASWRCVWHMIQNDLVLGWGLDFHLGYCAQGDPLQNIGIVDAEYIVHKGIRTLGVSETGQVPSAAERDFQASSSAIKYNRHWKIPKIKLRSGEERTAFTKRWERAVEEDKCWINRYKGEARNYKLARSQALNIGPETQALL